MLRRTAAQLFLMAAFLFLFVSQVESAPKPKLLKRQRLKSHPSPNAWFHLSLPADGKTNKPLPLYLFLHGGHVGTGTPDNIIAFHQIIPELSTSITIFPNHLYWFWSHPYESQYIMETLDAVMKRFRVDRKRIYVIGGSMGGNGAMHFAAEFPEVFAACAPLSCWCQFIPVKKAAVMPIFSAHGKKDKQVPIKWAHDIRKRLKGIKGLNLEYRDIDCGHQLPMKVYKDAVKWISQFRNPRTFSMKAMKARAEKLSEKTWMKRREYRMGYLNAKAWWLLTCENKSLRDYPKALILAEEANKMAKGKSAPILDTLGLAYFCCKKIEKAVATAEKALSMLPRKAPENVRKEFTERLAKYKKALKK